jgi:hypothetical protein
MQHLKNQYCSNCKRKKLEDRVIKQSCGCNQFATSIDGRQWTEIGSHTLIPKNGRLGLTAYLDWKEGHENAAEFDDFVVRGKQ